MGKAFAKFTITNFLYTSIIFVMSIVIPIIYLVYAGTGQLGTYTIKDKMPDEMIYMIVCVTFGVFFHFVNGFCILCDNGITYKHIDIIKLEGKYYSVHQTNDHTYYIDDKADGLVGFLLIMLIGSLYRIIANEILMIIDLFKIIFTKLGRDEYKECSISQFWDETNSSVYAIVLNIYAFIVFVCEIVGVFLIFK